MRFLILCIFVPMLATGCSGTNEDKWTENRPATYKVKGIIIFDGGPLEGATVAFRSTGADPQTAVGVTDAEGKFALQTFGDADGAVAGKHLVTVTKIVTEQPPEGINLDEVEFIPKEESVIPETFGNKETSNLTATVEENDENDITLELLSE